MNPHIFVLLLIINVLIQYIVYFFNLHFFHFSDSVYDYELSNFKDVIINY